jgi:exodeoxyribonuclease VII small subunit
MSSTKKQTTLPQEQSSSNASPDPIQDPNWNYEATVNQIEEIVTSIETGDLDLAELFSQFEIAVSQLNQCETFLQNKQAQMDLLLETLED